MYDSICWAVSPLIQVLLFLKIFYLFDSLLTLSLTFMPTADAALRRVTYEEMLEDWFSLSAELATPEGKPTSIKISELQ